MYLEVIVTSWTIQSNKIEDTVPQPPTVDTGGNNEYPTSPSYYSKVNSSGEWRVLHSQIESTKVMTMDIEGEVNFFVFNFLLFEYNLVFFCR